MTQHDGRAISATGIGTNIAEAELRHDGERAERMAHALRGERGALPWAQATAPIFGMAAGRDGVAQVQSRAILELIERWTCQSWWAGTLPASQPGPPTEAAFARAQENWKRRTPRRTGLLQLGNPLLPPTCVAWSCDRSGHSLCFGTACGMDGPKAMTAALRELFQMEFGLSVIQHRKAGGVELTGSELHILDRADLLSVETMTDHFQEAGDTNNRFQGDLFKALADAGIPVAVNQLEHAIDGHRIVIATSADLEVVSSGENWCDTALRWKLYGA
ncbi:YcaO-like family protein [Sedimentitalea todarodis]|uniref:YcaO-like family protein n=1 Tax=Sedimentitalea todarodis TaxID=1631240 RepID=A0ABU3VD60_9RHOB|nr:YcaO-like family protein [Sedimentitalea todarodis]MDU9003674.1 YcaO-like family protein [Sedimentitalea todarodis]